MNDQTTNDVRRRIVETLQSGTSIKEVSEVMGVNIRTVQRIWKEFNLTGEINKKKQGGNKPKM